MTASSSSDNDDASPTVSLLYVLMQTFSALGLGLICVRTGLIDTRKRDMRAIEFYIGRIALPLLVFKVIATADLGNLLWGVVVSCCCGKLFVYYVTFCVTYFAYKTDRPRSKRLMTANIFGFFTTASNDFAIGLPVINALYGDEMAVYIAANVFIFQTCFQPMAMVIVEVAAALDDSQEQAEVSRRRWIAGFCARILKGIFQNLIIIGTLLGIVYQLLFKSTLITEGNQKKFPHPLQDIVELWTAPFTMLFLFLNGASLTSARVAFWPLLLTLMKVLVCAYVGFFIAQRIVPEHTGHMDFAFFYGTIPAGGAPLVFAQQYDSSVVGLVASASLFGLLLAGPVEFMTALFMGTGHHQMEYFPVHQIVAVISSASIACSSIFLIFAVILWKEWPFGSRVIGIYGVVVFLYSVFTTILVSKCLDAHEDHFLLMDAFLFLQNASYLLVTYLAFLLMSRWYAPRCARAWVVILVLLLSAVAAFAIPYPNTWHEVVMSQEAPDRGYAIILAVWDFILLAVLLCIAAWGVFSKRGQARVTSEQHSIGSPGGWSNHTRTEVGPSGVATTLVGLQTIRLLMMTVNAGAFAAAWPKGTARGFTPMFILVNVLEHGQGVFVLICMIFHGSTQSHIRKLCTRMRSCGWTFNGLMEVEPTHEPLASRETSRDSIAGASLYPQSPPMRLPHTIAEDAEKPLVIDVAIR